MDTKSLSLNDIYERTQLSAGHRRQIAQSKLGSTKKSQAIKIKTEQQNSTTSSSPLLTNNAEHPISGFQQQLNKSQSLLMIGRMNQTNSDSDDDLDIKQERISPIESKYAARNSHGIKTKRKLNSNTAMKKVAKKMKMSVNASSGHMNANSSTVRVKEENITIHHEPSVNIKTEPTNIITPSINTMSKYVSAVKPVTLSDLESIDMMPIDLEDCSNIDIVNDVDDNQIVYKTPELMQETHVCYFSLIRDIFCSTQYHRTTMDALQDKVSAWLSNPITALNDWYSQADDWFSLLSSAINFLAGEFADQPEDFVPYLEYKKSMHIYQWIGAGRDSDQHLSPLCDYWLNRRNEMGASQSGFSDDDDIQLNELSRSKYNSSGELNDSGTIADRSLSPLPPRCPTTWTVGKASNIEIEEFRQQERRRFENPHLSFTYRMHGYESVVGPVKGIYTQLPAFTKARGHNMLTIDRPNFVTILTLVRDATARLPNGEGTRADICELLRSSQYINPEAADNVLQTIVSGALDRMHTENDPCVKYDPKRKIWIYLHRSRTEEEFERMHQQFQGKSKHKKQSTRKIKTKSGKSSCVVATKPADVVVSNIQQKSVLVPISRTVAPQTKPNVLFTSTPIQATARLLPSSQVIVPNESKLKSDAPLISTQSPSSFQLPALSSIQSPSLVQISNHPPLLNKITAKSPAIKAELVPIKQTNLQKMDKLEHIDVEASLEAHTTPILVNKNSPQMPSLIVDNKFSKIINQKTKKQVPALVTPSSNTMSPLTTTSVLSSTTPIKVSTSSGIQTVHVSSAFAIPGKSTTAMTSGQSILINQNQSQPPLYVTNKKIIKPPPLVPQSSPSNQNFIIPINISLNQQINKPSINQQGTKLIKTTMPALTSTSAPKSLLQQQQVLKPIQRSVQPGKSLINPSVAAANITLQQQQKLLSSNTPNAQVQIRAQQQQQQPKLTATAVKAQGTTLSPIQQRQILQNIISQQQKQNQRPNMISLVSSNSVIVNSTQSNQMQTSQFQAAIQSQQTLQQQQPKTVIVSQPNLVQKIVTTPAVSMNTTTSTQSDSSPLNSQIIQIHQVNQQQPGKVQRVSAASLTPQQQQNILQSIKQQQLRVQQSGSPQQQSLIIKQQQVQKQQPTLIQQPVGSPKPGKLPVNSHRRLFETETNFAFSFFPQEHLCSQRILRTKYLQSLDQLHSLHLYSNSNKQ